MQDRRQFNYHRRQFGLASYRFTRRYFQVGVAILAVVTVAACSAESTPQSKSPPTGANALDSLQLESLQLIRQAQTHVRDLCMRDNGFSQLVQTATATSTKYSLSDNPQIYQMLHLSGPRTAAAAEQFGFGESESAIMPSVVSMDPSFDAAIIKCESDAFADLTVSQDDVYAYSDIINNIAADAYADTEQARLRFDREIEQCLKKDGYTRLPNSDGKLPDQYGVRTGALAGNDSTWKPEPIEGSIQISPASPAREYMPSAEEKLFSKKFVGCLDSTGVGVESDVLFASAAGRSLENYEEQILDINMRIKTGAIEAAKIMAQG